MSERISKYLVGNGYIDVNTQKAFVGGLSGCEDHNLVMGEVINHAKTNGRTAHITWFDLEDAFGSVSHELIQICMDRMHLPAEVKGYIISLYEKLRGKVRTSKWFSEEFVFFPRRNKIPSRTIVLQARVLLLLLLEQLTII